ncbi:Uncharacterised protein [Leminorella richardii]|uniref:Uncharacterized protein n=1 Tax=Leminorella richardii TaxID=158841 RepID=A0A2X4UAA0_9GAMM|nr:Uncharacterised protein [Leminorella richardii]
MNHDFSMMSSPRTWRCFFAHDPSRYMAFVFSTYVEVFLATLTALAERIRLLHVRGGVSTFVNGDNYVGQSSPRTWRCFCWRQPHCASFEVFSTYVEVFLAPLRTWPPCRSLLHVRGGVSLPFASYQIDVRSSPRTWRCFQLYGQQSYGHAVFSTYMEVFPTTKTALSLSACLLHLRGGVSFVCLIITTANQFSSHSVEVFPSGRNVV